MPTNPTDVVSPGFTVNATTPIVISLDLVQGENGAPGTPGAGINWRDDWQTGLQYEVNDGVSRNGGSYIARVQNTSIDPATDNGSVWGVLCPPGQPGPPGPPGVQYKGVWAATTSYVVNDLVARLGASYIALSPSTGIDPATDNGTHWELFAASGSGGDMYKSAYATNGQAGVVDHAALADTAPWTGISGRPSLPATIGDMLKSTYDQNNDGIVDQAAAVPWVGITGRPTTYSPSPHEATHLPGGADPLPLVATTTAGLLKAISGLASDFIDGTGTCHDLVSNVPLVSTTKAGLLKAISGLTSDFVDGTGSCQNLLAAIPLATPSQNGLLKQISGNITDYCGGDNNFHALPSGNDFGDLIPPASPSPYDDEFTSSTINSKWTLSGTGAGKTIVQQAPTYLQMALAYGATGATKLQATQTIVSSSTFMWQTKVRLCFAPLNVTASGTSGYAEAGLGLTVGTKGFAIYLTAQSYVYGTTPTVESLTLSINVQKGSNFSTNLATQMAVITGLDIRFRLGIQAGNLVAQISNDGYNWTTVYSEVFATGGTLGGSLPTTLILDLDNTGGSAAAYQNSAMLAAFDYVRMIA